MAEQQPAIGRMVHFVLPNDGRCRYPGEHRPAVIVKIWSGGHVNLQVFIDGSNDYPDERVAEGLHWETSVPFSNEHGLRTWHWPEFVPPK